MLPTRKVPDCCLPQVYFDPPARVQEAFGGREFFFQIDARAIHRIGLFKGLGWMLPVGGAKDGINVVRIRLQEDAGGLWQMELARSTDDVNVAFETPIRVIKDIATPDLRATYERETIS